MGRSEPGAQQLQQGAGSASELVREMLLNGWLMTEQTKVVGKRILVVEDDPAARDSLNVLLKIDRHTVVGAENGIKALALFTGDRFDLVVLDYFMPGMQGDEVARSIKLIAPRQPVVMVTAYLEKLVDANLPVDAILSKPFGVDELRQTIKKVLC